MTDLLQKLFELRDAEYADFQARLTPTISPDLFIGIRVPVLRKFAKEYCKEDDCRRFLSDLPHKYYDENMLHAILISLIKDYDECIKQTEIFLPYVDNWAVCDIMSPKVFAKHKDLLINKIREWSSSNHVYTCRFGLEMLMTHYLDSDYCPDYLQLPVQARADEYYVKMMVSWFFATALTKQWSSAIRIIENKELEPWTHNKAIQKARESFRITPEQKAYLNTLKIK